MTGLAGITFYNSLDGCWYQLRVTLENGGNGSGNFHHAGRKGKVGGSAKNTEVVKATNTADIDSLGKEYTGVTGKEAIDLLLKEKQGFVRRAFYRDDIGDIALAWGVAGKPNTKGGFGLAHIIRRRIEEHQDLERVLSEMPNVIEKGIKEKIGRGRYRIVLDDLMVIVDPKYRKNGNEYDLQFVISAYEEYKK